MGCVTLLTSRLLLRDFVEADREGFLAYQTDPRYRQLYDIPEGSDCHAQALFEMFLVCQADQPRRNYQLGVFDRRTDLICGCGGLRMCETDSTVAAVGIELRPDAWGRFGLAIEAVMALIDYGFETLPLERLIGSTASGNTRMEKLARGFRAICIKVMPKGFRKYSSNPSCPSKNMGLSKKS